MARVDSAALQLYCRIGLRPRPSLPWQGRGALCPLTKNITTDARCHMAQLVGADKLSVNAHDVNINEQIRARS